MSLIDRVIGVFSPEMELKRVRARHQIMAYEAARPDRTHRANRERRTANDLTKVAAVSLREQARYLDNNNDIVIGVLDKLEERVIGPKGIIVDPQPLFNDGKIATEFADEIRSKWREWSVSPDVTGQYTRPILERLMLRTWLRDGEVFVHLVKGRASGLKPVAGVNFWIEALEPDFVPLDRNDDNSMLKQGIFHDKWSRPIGYMVYEILPSIGLKTGKTKRVSSDNMLHIKHVRRLHQVRGHSLLAGVLKRLASLKDYEEYELVAAKIAAALGMYIKKGTNEDYDPNDKADSRELDIEPGIIFDDLLPGEDIGMIKSDRPNPNLENFRNGQLRAASGGVRVSYSAMSRNYDGTYSSQRQELVEATDGYFILQDYFIGTCTRPMYRQFLQMAILSGRIAVPGNIDKTTLFNAVYSGPVMPWINPLHEAQAWNKRIRGGAATEADWITASGGSPAEVKRKRKTEVDENKELGLIFDTDPANDKGGNNSASFNDDEQAENDGKKRPSK